MKRIGPVILISSFAFSGIISGADQRINEPITRDASEHVRLTYNQFNTPDAAVFDVLLDMIRTYTETHTESQLENWVFSQMNATWDSSAGAWITSQPDTLKYSRHEIGPVLDLLVSVANESHENSLNSKRSIFCPKGKPLNMEQKLAALEQRNIDKQVDARYYLDKTMDALGESGSADLRGWLSRIKKGYLAKEYNYRSLWAGREAELTKQFSQFCKTVGVTQ